MVYTESKPPLHIVGAVYVHSAVHYLSTIYMYMSGDLCMQTFTSCMITRGRLVHWRPRPSTYVTLTTTWWQSEKKIDPLHRALNTVSLSLGRCHPDTTHKSFEGDGVTVPLQAAMDRFHAVD